MSCECVPCSSCDGSGDLWFDDFGRFISIHRSDDMGHYEPCEDCDGTGIVAMCDECTEAEMMEED